LHNVLSPFSEDADGVRVRVRLTPNAQQDRIDGIVVDEQGKGVLRIAVNAIPEQGRANKALIKYVAKQWRIPKTHIHLVHGAKDRTKTLHIDADDGNVLRELESWVAQLS